MPGSVRGLSGNWQSYRDQPLLMPMQEVLSLLKSLCLSESITVARISASHEIC
jgi:hypothetical protein